MLYDGKPGPINRKTVDAQDPRHCTRRNRRKGALCSEDDSAISDTVPPFRSTSTTSDCPGILKSQANQNSTRFYCHALFHSTRFSISSSSLFSVT